MQSNMDSETIGACFLKSPRGRICIALSDAAYVRAEPVIFDRAERSVYAVLHEAAHFIGQVSEDMAEAFADNEEVLLCAVQADGNMLEISTRLAVTGVKGRG